LVDPAHQAGPSIEISMAQQQHDYSRAEREIESNHPLQQRQITLNPG
jgi:hypothetical protein